MIRIGSFGGMSDGVGGSGAAAVILWAWFIAAFCIESGGGTLLINWDTTALVMPPKVAPKAAI